MSFPRLAVRGFARENLAEVGGRNPVLVFAREAVVGDAKQRAKRDFDADFFAGFMDGALLERLEKIHFAPTMLQQPASGGRLRNVSSTRP